MLFSRQRQPLRKKVKALEIEHVPPAPLNITYIDDILGISVFMTYDCDKVAYVATLSLQNATMTGAWVNSSGLLIQPFQADNKKNSNGDIIEFTFRYHLFGAQYDLSFHMRRSDGVVISLSDRTYIMPNCTPRTTIPIVKSINNYDRNHNWSIDVSATPDVYTVNAGDQVNVDYKIKPEAQHVDVLKTNDFTDNFTVNYDGPSTYKYYLDYEFQIFGNVGTVAYHTVTLVFDSPKSLINAIPGTDFTNFTPQGFIFGLLKTTLTVRQQLVLTGEITTIGFEIMESEYTSTNIYTNINDCVVLRNFDTYYQAGTFELGFCEGDPVYVNNNVYGVGNNSLEITDTVTAYTIAGAALASGSKTITINVVGHDLEVTSASADLLHTTQHMWSVSQMAPSSPIYINPYQPKPDIPFNVVIKTTTNNVESISGTMTVSNSNNFDVNFSVVALVTSNGQLISINLNPSVIVAANNNVTFDFVSDNLDVSLDSNAIVLKISWDQSQLNTPSDNATRNVTMTNSSFEANATVCFTNSLFGGCLQSVNYKDTPLPLVVNNNDYILPTSGCVDLTNNVYIRSLILPDPPVLASDTSTVSLCVPSDLILTFGNIDDIFTRKYNWSLNKTNSSPQPLRVYDLLNPPNIDYEITVSQLGHNDFSIQARGLLIIRNPNAGYSVVAHAKVVMTSDSAVIIAYADGSSYNGETIAIDGGSSTILTYQCSYSDLGPHSLEATLSWDRLELGTVNETTSISRQFNLIIPTQTVDQNVKVKDSCQCLQIDTIDGAQHENENISFDYSYNQYPLPLVGCQPYLNTAELVGDNGVVLSVTSSPVCVCVPLKTGAKSREFWLSSSGQGILQGNANLLSFFYRYKPYRGLKQKLTVADILSMLGNTDTPISRLRGELTATILNVFFSMGSNLIQAPSNIGDVLVDLTAISGQDVSAAFGGSSSMKVDDMVTFVANQYVDNNDWYGLPGPLSQILQTLSYNAFSAINKEQVFAPGTGCQ